MIAFDDVEPSADIRARLAREGRPVLLAFSRGKDSVAAWLALRSAGVEVIPVHLYRIPGIGFERESIRYFNEFFDAEIIELPHPWFYRALTGYVYQPPERCGVIDAANLRSYTYEQLFDVVREDLGLPSDTWLCEGVRACDSAVRRLAMRRHGPMRPGAGYKCSVVWDWQIADVRAAIADAGVELPVDYEWFGRSFDGIDLRFMAPLRENAPEDYAIVKEWFPLIDLVFRREVLVA